MTAYGYIRVSTVGQADGFGPELQEQAITAKYPDAVLYRDEGVSGVLLDRPALGEALASLGEGDVFVVARLDRLARDLVTQELLLREIRAHDAELVSCAEGEQSWLNDDPDDPSRKFIRLVLGAAAGYERDMVKLRMSLGRKAKRAQGGYIGGEAIFGYRVNNGGLEEDEREQMVIESMRNLRDMGHSLDEIAAIENDATQRRGLPHHPRRASSWTKQAVHRVLARANGHA